MGDHFVYARARSAPLPPADSLRALVAAARPTRETLVAWLDCEVSYGLVRGGAWEVRYSTLPWREGLPLDLPDRVEVRGDTLRLRDPPPGGSWSWPVLAMTPDDLRVLFPRP